MEIRISRIGEIRGFVLSVISRVYVCRYLCVCVYVFVCFVWNLRINIYIFVYIKI